MIFSISLGRVTATMRLSAPFTTVDSVSGTEGEKG